MENIKISVIMPVHNRCSFLKEAVDSLINQTFMQFELICVDDGSEDDDTIEYLNTLEKRYDFIHVIRLAEAKGAGNARNEGMKLACGEYIMFLDSDDVFNPNLLKKMYMEIVKNNADIVFNGYRAFSCEGDKKEFYPMLFMTLPEQMNDNSSELWIYRMMKNPWTKMFRTEYLKENNICFQNLPSCNDVAFSVLANLLTTRYAFVHDEPLIMYRVSNSQISNRRDPMCAYDAAVYIEDELNKRGILDSDERIRHQFLVFFFVTCLYEMKGSKDINKKMLLYEKMTEYFKSNPVSFNESDTAELIKKFTS